MRLNLYNFGFTKLVKMSVRYDGNQKALILDLRWLIISTVLLFTSFPLQLHSVTPCIWLGTTHPSMQPTQLWSVGKSTFLHDVYI